MHNFKSSDVCISKNGDPWGIESSIVEIIAIKDEWVMYYNLKHLYKDHIILGRSGRKNVMPLWEFVNTYKVHDIFKL